MKRFLLATAVLLLGISKAYGDGGAMLLHQDNGPFTLTLFAAPQPLHVGAADLSVLVQDRGSGEVLLDPVIDLTLAQQPPVRLATGQSSNRLLQAATVQFPRAGRWKLEILVQRGKDVARFSTECSVDADYSRAVLVLFYVLLPAVVIVVFVCVNFCRGNETWRKPARSTSSGMRSKVKASTRTSAGK